jgi:hypothetical protein
MTVAGISPTYIDRPCAITRATDIAACSLISISEGNFGSVSYFTHLSHPPRLPDDTLVPSLGDSSFAHSQLLAGLQNP